MPNSNDKESPFVNFTGLFDVHLNTTEKKEMSNCLAAQLRMNPVEEKPNDNSDNSQPPKPLKRTSGEKIGLAF